jgi:hypothetical protein
MPTHYTGDETTRRALGAYLKLSRARKAPARRTGQLLAESGLTESQFWGPGGSQFSRSNE